MRILHTADWHLGKTLEGRDRQQEQIAVLNEICQIADDEKIDLVLIAGDIYQTVNPPAWAENLFYETLHRLNNFGRRGVVAISGNHDQPERIRAANPLADKQGIYLVGLPTDQLLPSNYINNGQVFARKAGIGWLELAFPKTDETAVVSILPYPSESRLKQLFSDSVDQREIRNAYSDYINRWFISQKEVFHNDSINLALSHLFIQGGEISDSEVEIQVGGAYTVNPKHIPDYFQYVALGHLHRAQAVNNTAALTRYSGSPLAYSFSEANHKKSVTIIEAQPEQNVIVKEVMLNSGKPLIQKKINYGLIELESWINNQKSLPAWIDLELHVEHPLSLEEIQRIRKLHDGIINIRVVTPELERALEIIELSAKEPKELFERFYKYKTGAAPKREVTGLFIELYSSQLDGEVSEE